MESHTTRRDSLALLEATVQSDLTTTLERLQEGQCARFGLAMARQMLEYSYSPVLGHDPVNDPMELDLYFEQAWDHYDELSTIYRFLRQRCDVINNLSIANNHFVNFTDDEREQIIAKVIGDMSVDLCITLRDLGMLDLPLPATHDDDEDDDDDDEDDDVNTIIDNIDDLWNRHHGDIIDDIDDDDIDDDEDIITDSDQDSSAASQAACE